MPKLRKMYIAIYLSSAVLHLLWFALSATFGEHNFQLYDSAHYLILSENLSAHGVFSRALQAPFYPDLARTPGYPVFLLALQSLGLPLFAVACIQSLLAALVPLLMFDLLRQHLQTSRAVSIALALLFVDCSVLLFAPYILTDGLFYIVFSVLVWSLLRDIDREKANFKRAILLPALLTGCLVMIRPIAIFLPFLLIIWWVYRRNTLRAIVVGAFLVFALPGGWVARNYATFGTISMSSMGPNNLLLFNAAGVQAIAEQRDFEAVQREWMAAAQTNFDWKNDPHATRDYMQWCQREALAIFKAHPQAAVRVFAENGLSYFLKPPRGYFDLNFNLKSSYTPLGELGDQRQFSSRLSALRNETSPIGLSLTAAQIMVNLVQLFLAAIGFVYLWKNNRAVFYFLGAGILYFWFLSLFTQTDARFRLPVVPLLVVASGFGFEKLVIFRILKTKVR